MTATFDHVTATVTAGLLVNLNAGGAANTAANVLTVQNSTINTNGGTDPVIGHFHASSPWTINIENSTIINNRNTTNNDGNASVINLTGAGEVAVNVKNSTITNARKINAIRNNSSIFYLGTPAKKTVSVDADTVLNITPTAAAAQHSFYRFVLAAANTYTYTDAGATYNVSAVAAQNGVMLPATGSNTDRFEGNGKSIANGNWYCDKNATEAVSLKKATGTLNADETNVLAGNYYKIGETYYATLAAAATASAENDTIYLLGCNDHTDDPAKFTKAGVTLDGQGFRYTSNVSYAIWVTATTTFKNISMGFSVQGFSYCPQTEGDHLTLDGVTGRNNGGLFMAVGHTRVATKAVPAALTIKDSTINGYGEEPFLVQIAGVTWTVNIQNSTITKEAAANANNRTIQFASNLTVPAVLNIDGTSRLINNSTHASRADVITGNAKTVTVNVANGATFSLNSASGATAGNFFQNSANFTINDNGGRYIVGKYIATKGATFPVISNVNGSPAVAQTVFTNGAASIPNGGTYTNAEATEATTFVLGERDLTYAEMVAAGSIWRLGAEEKTENLYGSLAAAYAAAKENDTVYLLADATLPSAVTFSKPGVTVDGLDHAIAVPNGYSFIFTNTTTLKNMNLTFANQGFSFNPTDDDQVFTLDHVTATNGNGLFAAVGHNRGMVNGKRASVIVKDCTLTSGGEEVMLIQNDAYWTVEILNSTLTNNGSGGSDKNHNMVIQFGAVPHPVALHIDGTSRLTTNSAQEEGSRLAVIWLNASDSTHEIKVDEGAELTIGNVKKVYSFIDGTGVAALTDGGAKYTVSAEAQKLGYSLPAKITAGETVIIGFSDGTDLCKAGKAFEANAEADAPLTYTAVTFSADDFAMLAGASMKTEGEGNGLRFTVKVGAGLSAKLGANTGISMVIVPTKLARVASDGALNTVILAEDQYYTIVLTQGKTETDGSVLYAAALLGLPANATSYGTQYSAQAFLTVTYSDNTTATFHTAYSKAENARSLHDVAAALKAQAGYVTNEAVEAVISTVEVAAQ